MVIPFTLVVGGQDEASVSSICPHSCHASNFKVAEGSWLLGIDSGSVDVRCEVCRCSFDQILASGTELLYTVVDIPVHMEFEKEPCGYHEGWCDCSWWYNLSPRRERTCGDWPAPCNCDDPTTHGGHGRG